MTATRQVAPTGVATKTGRASTKASARCRTPQLPQNAIPIGRDYRVGADELNIIVYKRRGKAFKAWGYFSTFGAALVELAHQSVRDTELASLQAVQDRMTQLEHDLLGLAYAVMPTRASSHDRPKAAITVKTRTAPSRSLVSHGANKC